MDARHHWSSLLATSQFEQGACRGIHWLPGELQSWLRIATPAIVLAEPEYLLSEGPSAHFGKPCQVPSLRNCVHSLFAPNQESSRRVSFVRHGEGGTNGSAGAFVIAQHSGATCPRCAPPITSSARPIVNATTAISVTGRTTPRASRTSSYREFLFVSASKPRQPLTFDSQLISLTALTRQFGSRKSLARNNRCASARAY